MDRLCDKQEKLEEAFRKRKHFESAMRKKFGEIFPDEPPNKRSKCAFFSAWKDLLGEMVGGQPASGGGSSGESSSA